MLPDHPDLAEAGIGEGRLMHVIQRPVLVNRSPGKASLALGQQLFERWFGC
jgi:hypothetical protein